MDGDLTPAVLLRLPLDALAALPRLAAELAATRRTLERVADRLEDDLVSLRRDFSSVQDDVAHMRCQLDDLAEHVPGETEGPITKVKQALTGD
jgi:hypothetical protein